MKKVIILTAAAMAFSFVTPQLSNAMKSQNKIAVVQDKDDKDDKYKEIKAEELPEAVTKSIANAYTGYKIDKAYKDKDEDSYKVNVAMGSLRYDLFYDKKGELVKVEEPTAERVGDAIDKTGKDADRAIDKSEKKTSETWEKTEKKTNDAWDKSDKKMSDPMHKSSIDTTKTGKSKTSNVEPSNNNYNTFPSNTQTK
ncbi:MAG: hypothetical protein ACM3O8_07410 [Methylococcaceae bacterium]|nr:hypothetical protein [Prolixibacteraceae bacterium]